MRSVRKSMVARASRAERWGVVLGTLGRQGNPAILEHLERRLRECGKAYAVFLISEMTPAKMAMLKGADAFAQIACPRLSIDWGEDFQKPVLTPYEAEVALGAQPWWELPARRRAGERRRTPWTTTREGAVDQRVTSSRRRAARKRKPRRPRRQIVAEG